MDTIRKQVSIDEIPESWRDGLGDAEQVVVTLEAVTKRDESDEDVLKSVAGLWKDRDDLDELYGRMREVRREKFDRIVPDD